MRRILEEISSIEGVRGSCICNLEGEVVASTEFGGVAKPELADIGRETAIVLTAFRLAGREMTDLDVSYAGARLLACAVGSALLINICEPEVDGALLRLALNVQKSRLRDDRKIQSQVASTAATTRGARGSTDMAARHLLNQIAGIEVNHA